MKNEKGSRAAAASVTLKPLIMSGTIGPNMFVNNDMTKKTTKTSATMERLRVIKRKVPAFTCVLFGYGHFCAQFKAAGLAFSLRRQSQGNHLHWQDFQDRSNPCAGVRKAEGK